MSQSKPTRKKAQHQSVKQTQSKEKNEVKQTQQITVANPRILKKKKKKPNPNILKSDSQKPMDGA